VGVGVCSILHRGSHTQGARAPGPFSSASLCKPRSREWRKARDTARQPGTGSLNCSAPTSYGRHNQHPIITTTTVCSGSCDAIAAT
jgi:hypothetical protein